MEIKITKNELLKEVNNEMTHCWYYLTYFKVYNDDKTRYFKGKFIQHIEQFDIQEYFEKDRTTKSEHKQYTLEMGYSFINNYIGSYDNLKEREQLLMACNETITSYNGY